MEGCMTRTEAFEGQALNVEIGRMNYPDVNHPARYPAWRDEHEALSKEERDIRFRLQGMNRAQQEAYALWCIDNERDTLSPESLETFRANA
jgi:hypothetical protein